MLKDFFFYLHKAFLYKPPKHKPMTPTGVEPNKQSSALILRDKMSALDLLRSGLSVFSLVPSKEIFKDNFIYMVFTLHAYVRFESIM